MTKEEILQLPITTILEHKSIGLDSRVIQFDMADHSYNLFIDRLEDGRYAPTHVAHQLYRDYCPLCEDKGTFCSLLSSVSFIYPLFHRLIASNELRLIWLYREYKEEE